MLFLETTIILGVQHKCFKHTSPSVTIKNLLKDFIKLFYCFIKDILKWNWLLNLLFFYCGYMVVKYSDCPYSLVPQAWFFAKAPAVLSNIAFALSVHITAQSEKTFSIVMKILLTTQTPEKIPPSLNPHQKTTNDV